MAAAAGEARSRPRCHPRRPEARGARQDVRIAVGEPDAVVQLGETPVPVAASFAEFLERYLRDPDSLL